MSALSPADARLGLAVSGGADSLAMLVLAHRAMPHRIAAATVDHALRAESAGEAAAVAALCRRLGVPHAVLGVEVPRRGNLQAQARAARYAALADWAREAGCAALLVAHHSDDQAETLLMRANRGAGLRGLAGMRAVASVPGAELPLLRPLLGWRRAELAAAVGAAGVAPTDDPSNRDRRFERVRVRAGLAAAGWLDPAGLAASAARLAEADAALAWASEREWAERVKATESALTYLPLAPRAVRLRVLERVVAALGTSAPRGAEVARWDDALSAGGTATLSGVRGTVRAGAWRFTPAAPPRRPRAP